ncbi:MAG: hypothetical protein ACI4TJ_00160 [Candidatus Cryptobacteroides sp.]
MRVKITIPEIAVLRDQVEAKFKKPLSGPKVFNKAAETISQNQSDRISETTLQRLWGYKSGYETVSVNTLDILCRYCGYDNWGDFKAQVRESAQVESELFEGEVIEVALLTPGTRIRIGWRPNRVCVIEYLGNFRFRTLSAENAKLHPGDEFTCTKMQLGRELRLDDLQRGDSKMSYIAGSRNGLTLLELITP